MGWIDHLHDGLRLEPIVRLDDLVFLRFGPIHIAKSALMHESEMGVVEGIFHQTQGRGVPLVIELMDLAIAGRHSLRHIRNVGQRLIKRHPDIAIALLRMIGRRAALGQRLSRRKLRDGGELAGGVIGPAVIGADDMTILDPALGEFRRAVAAAIRQRCGLVVRAKEHHDILAQKREGLRPIAQGLHGNGRVPELAENRLACAEHGDLGLGVSAFARDFALVPSAKRQLRQPGHEEEERDACKRDQEKRGEHAGNVELEAGLQDFIGKA